jgi:hypothetical protein
MIVGYPTFTVMENGGLCLGEPEIADLAARDTPAETAAPHRAGLCPACGHFSAPGETVRRLGA